MARVVFGQGVANMKGRIGGTVFSTNPSGAYARNINRPSYRRTARRNNNLPDINTLTQLWFYLEPETRIAWNDYSSAHTWQNSFGVVKHPTGSNLFISLNTNRLDLGLSTFDDPPTYDSTPDTTLCTIAPYANGWNVDRDIHWENTDLVTVFNITAPMSIGTLYLQNKIRKIVTLPHPLSALNPVQTYLDDYYGLSFPVDPLVGPQTFALGVHGYHIRKSTGIAGLGFSYVWPGP